MMMRSLGMTIGWVFLSTLGHLQVWIWLKSAFPALAEWNKRRVQIGIALLAVMPSATRAIANATHGAVGADLFAVVMTETMTVLIAAIPIAIVRLTGALVARTASAPATETEPDLRITRRRAVERVGGTVVLAATTSTLGYGAIKGRFDYRVEELVVRIPGLPRALDGYTLAQVSDLHVGNFVQARELDLGLSLVKGLKPDLIVVTGDLVDFDPTFVPAMVTALSKLSARDGVAAILGNHDYYAGAPAIEAALRAAGIDLLKNDGRVIRAGDGGGFALLGADDLWSARYGGAGPRLDRALSAVPRELPRVLLSHQPASVDIWAGQVALQLSGHTHGGQVNPGFRPADFLMRYVAGRYEVSGTTLYVNRGFGVVGPPARVGAPPEITKVVLVSA